MAEINDDHEQNIQQQNGLLRESTPNSSEKDQEEIQPLLECTSVCDIFNNSL